MTNAAAFQTGKFFGGGFGVFIFTMGLQSTYLIEIQSQFSARQKTALSHSFHFLDFVNLAFTQL